MTEKIQDRRLNIASKLVQSGLAEFYAKAGSPREPSSHAAAGALTPDELADMGATLLTPDKTGEIHLRPPHNEQPLKDKHPHASIDAPEVGKSEQSTDQPSPSILIDVLKVSTQDKIDRLGMQLVLGDQAREQVSQANAAFDVLRDTQVRIRRREAHIASLTSQSQKLTATIATIERRFDQAKKSGEIPHGLTKKFNSIRKTLKPRLDHVQSDLQQAEARLNRLQDTQQSLRTSHQKEAPTDPFALDTLDEEIVEQAIQAGNRQYEEERSTGKRTGRRKTSFVPEHRPEPHKEDAPVSDKLGLLAQAVTAPALTEDLFLQLTQAFPDIALVGEDKTLIPAGVQQAADFLVTQRIGESVHARTQPFETFAAAVPTDARKELWQTLLPKAREAIRALKEQLSPQQHASSLELWTTDERNLLLSGRIDAPDWDTQHILILTAGVAGKAGIPTWEATRDAFFIAFDRLSFGQKQALAQRWDPPLPGENTFRYTFPAEKIGGLIDLSLYAPAMDTKAIDNRTDVSLVDLPLAVDRGIVHTRQFTDSNFVPDVKQRLDNLATALSPIDVNLSRTVFGINDAIAKEATPRDVITALRAVSDADRGHLNDFVYASVLLRNMKENFRGGSYAFASRPVNLQLDDSADQNAGITMTAVNWRSPVLSAMMPKENIVPVGTKEAQFTLTIRPDSRIVITGPNANGKTVFAKMMTAAMMGYPVLADSFTIAGSREAFENIRAGFVPHFKEPKIAGLSTFQRVAMGLRRALTERFPILDESVQGTTSAYARRINAGLLLLTPQMTVLHGAGETLAAALSASPSLKDTIIPITVEGYRPTIGPVAMTSGGLELVQQCVPPGELLHALHEEVAITNREHPDNTAITLPPSPEVGAVSAYLSAHAAEVGEGESKRQTDAELLAELGFHNDDGGIIWLKRLLTRLALVEKDVSPEVIGRAEQLLDNPAEQQLLLRALSDPNPEHAPHRNRVTEWFMTQQGRPLPDIITQWVNKLPSDMRTPVERYLGIDTAHQPYQDTVHMATLLAMREGRWEVARQFLASDTAHQLSPDAQATFAALLPTHRETFQAINSVNERCQALRQEPVLDALSAIGRDRINAEIATRMDNLLTNTRERGLTKEAREMVNWLAESQGEEAQLIERLATVKEPVARPLAEAMVHDLGIKTVPPQLIDDVAAILFYRATDQIYRTEINFGNFFQQLKDNPRFQDHQAAATVDAWSAFIATHLPRETYEKILLLPVGHSTETSALDWTSGMNSKQKKELAERMAWVLRERFSIPLHGYGKPQEGSSLNKAVQQTFTQAKQHLDPIAEIRNKIEQHEHKKQTAQALQEVLDAVASESPVTKAAVVARILPRKELFTTQWIADLKLYDELQRASSPELRIGQNVATIVEKESATLQDYCQALQRGAFGNHQTLEDLVSTLVANHVESEARDAFGQQLRDEVARAMSLDVLEVLSLAGYGRLYQAIGTSAVAKKGPKLELDGLVNIATIATAMAQDQRVRELRSADEIRNALREAVEGYKRAKGVRLTPGVTNFITGPNGSGKSTLAAAVGQAPIESKYTGRLTAARGTVPDFARVILVKGGETTAAMSKFTASLQAIIRMLRTIEAHTDEPTLVVMDEIGTGTNPDEAKVLRRAVACVLANYPNVTILTVDQEDDAWRRLNALDKPTAVMALTDDHEVRSATEFVDPGSIKALTADTIGTATPPTPMPEPVKTVFNAVQ